jgi:hypothetical protein
MMVKVFVRKSDNHVVGTADASRVDEEMQNILASELGGVASDYNVLDAPDKENSEVYVADSSSVRVVANPTLAATQANRASLKVKLTALGLTDDELKVLKL